MRRRSKTVGDVDDEPSAYITHSFHIGPKYTAFSNISTSKSRRLV